MSNMNHTFKAKLSSSKHPFKDKTVEAYVADNEKTNDLCFNIPGQDAQIYVPLKTVLKTLKRLNLI